MNSDTVPRRNGNYYRPQRPDTPPPGRRPPPTPEMASAADGTHPTGMHACYRPQTKFGARLCFYRCLSFCQQRGGSAKVHAGIHPPAKETTPLPRRSPLLQPPPHPRDRYCSGRYASYWNACLLWLKLLNSARKRRYWYQKQILFPWICTLGWLFLQEHVQYLP